MRRPATLAVLCALFALVTLVSSSAPCGANLRDARFRFGAHPLLAHPTPPDRATPTGGLGVTDWDTCGVVITPANTGLVSFQLVHSDGAQGAVVGWSDGRNAGKLTTFASRLSGTGTFVSGWNPGGNPVAVSDSSQVITASATDDAGGGFFLTTLSDPGFNYTHDLYIQHLTSAGSPAVGYPTGGKSMFTGDAGVGGMLADGSGGLFFGWAASGSTIRIKRIDATGAATGGWPAGGIDTGVPDQVNGEPALDGAGGVYLTWSTSTQIMIQRFVSTGTAAGWPAAGLVVAAPGAESNPIITRLSNGDALVAWEDPTSHFIYAMRVNANGTLNGSWTGGGTQVAITTGPQYTPNVLPDGSGGVYVSWHEQPGFFFGRPYVQHLTSAGVPASGWTTAGLPVISNDTEYASSNLVSDGAGGVIVSWTDLRNNNDGDTYIMRVLAGGTVDPGWTADGVGVCTITPGDQVFPVQVSDGAGGAIVTYLDYTDQNNPLVCVSRVLANGTVSALASLVDATAGSDRVELHWYTPDGSVARAIVERAEGSDEFVALGEVLADGAGHLRYEDRTVVAGATYRYRLAVPDGAGTTYLGQVTIRVPSAVAFGIEGFRPNPAGGEVSVAFALESGASARLELLDVAGRRVLSQEVGALGAGQHVLRLDRAASLPAGVYVLRLTQSGRVVTARSSIVR